MKQDDYLDREAMRPMDWQDKLVICAGSVASFVLFCILVWGPK
jgi:hypothetical protein